MDDFARVVLGCAALLRAAMRSGMDEPAKLSVEYALCIAVVSGKPAQERHTDMTSRGAGSESSIPENNLMRASIADTAYLIACS